MRESQVACPIDLHSCTVAVTLARETACFLTGDSEMPKALVTIEYDGSLSDSLRAIANLIDEYGDQFLSDPTCFFGIHNANEL